MQIKHDQIGWILPNLCKSLATIHGFLHSTSSMLQHSSDELATTLFVVRNEHSLHMALATREVGAIVRNCERRSSRQVEFFKKTALVLCRNTSKS